MTTEDEVMRLLRRADPDRGRADVASVDGTEYLAALRARSSDVDFVDTEPTATERSTNRHRWLSAVAAAAVVAVVAGGLVLAARDDDDVSRVATAPAPVGEGPVTTPPPETTTPPEIPLAGNGLIAFAGSSAESGDEIYVVAPDGTGLRALTSTPDEAEIAPAWSPDGTRLAFLRNVRHSLSASGELVVIDPATGDETFAAYIPMERNSDLFGRIRWSPDGRRIALNLANSGTDLVVDLETNTWTTISGRLLGWSPDGKWLVVGTLLVPTVLLDDTTELAVDSDVLGVRPLPVPADEFEGTVSWMPDSSAVAITLLDGSVRVDTIADGQYRTLIDDGAESTWSPDGRQLAYLRCDRGPDEVWVAAADGAGGRAVATSLTSPIWSPDGSLLLGAGPDGLFTVRPDGTGMTILTPNMPHPGESFDVETQTWTPASLDACVDAADKTRLVNGPVWQPLPPAASTGETTASAATDE